MQQAQQLLLQQQQQQQQQNLVQQHGLLQQTHAGMLPQVANLSRFVLRLL